MKHSEGRGILLLLAFTVFVSQLNGQSTNGSIGGTIEDATQALLPGVRVTVTNVNTGVASTTLANETGAYNVPNLPPGQYKVTAELPSFQTETKVNVEIGNAQQLRLNFVLKVAGAQQSVEVSVADSLLSTSSASVAGVLNDQRLRELPTVGNNVMDLFSTQPGIVSGFSGTAGQARSEASYETSISGLNVMGSVNVTRDGINNSASAATNLAGFQAATVLNPEQCRNSEHPHPGAVRGRGRESGFESRSAALRQCVRTAAGKLAFGQRGLFQHCRARDARRGATRSL